MQEFPRSRDMVYTAPFAFANSSVDVRVVMVNGQLMLHCVREFINFKRMTSWKNAAEKQTRKQKQLDKQQRRVKRAAERQMHPGPAVDKDADLAEIIPGPQPGQII